MPKVARLGDSLTTGGHGPDPTITSASGDVFTNNIPTARVTDNTSGHKDKKNQTGFPPIPIGKGSGSVFVNNLPIARVGDNTSTHADLSYGRRNWHKDSPHADTIAKGSSDVFADS